MQAKGGWHAWFVTNSANFAVASSSCRATVDFASFRRSRAPYQGNLWLVCLGILYCSLWPIQTINFLGTGARAFERKRN